MGQDRLDEQTRGAAGVTPPLEGPPHVPMVGAVTARAFAKILFQYVMPSQPHAHTPSPVANGSGRGTQLPGAEQSGASQYSVAKQSALWVFHVQGDLLPPDSKPVSLAP